MHGSGGDFMQILNPQAVRPQAIKGEVVVEDFVGKGKAKIAEENVAERQHLEQSLIAAVSQAVYAGDLPAVMKVIDRLEVLRLDSG